MKSGLTVRADNAQAIFDALKNIGNKDVLVGIPSDRAERGEGQSINNAELGYLHSYGGTIQIPEHSVTINRKINPEGSFANNGQFVRAKKSNFSTIHTVKAHAVTLPPRPFLDLGIAEKRNEIVSQLKQAASAILSGDQHAADVSLNRAGIIAADGAKGIIQAGDKLTPLSEATKRNRRSRGRVGEKPLYDTGELLRSITYVVGIKMPLLDVSELLMDPDFADDTLVCHRNAQTTDDDNFPINTPTDIPFIGVVTVDRSLEAKRMAAGQNINGAILIVTQFRLTQGQPGLDADGVTYRGREYRVTFVDPYTAYGAGFVQAHCELMDFDGGTPVE